ncbi:MAG: cohesin domain-containing protein [Betaproteobacteria bacterium]
MRYKRISRTIGALLVLALWHVVPAHAISVEFTTPTTTVAASQSFEMQIKLFGLGDYVAPTLAFFDVDVAFDNAAFDFESATFGDADPALGDQLDLFGLATTTSNVHGDAIDPARSYVNISEDTGIGFPLDALQAGDFVLATLTFKALSIGTGELGIFVLGLRDGDGNDLATDFAGAATVTVTAVPEPETFVAVVAGMLILAAVAGRRRARDSASRAIARVG